MTRYLGIALAVSLALLAVAGWLLKSSYETNGKLTNANASLTKQLNEARNANRERATIDRDVRSLPDDRLFNGLQ